MDGLVTPSDSTPASFHTRAHVEKYMELVSLRVTNCVLDSGEHVGSLNSGRASLTDRVIVSLPGGNEPDRLSRDVICRPLCPEIALNLVARARHTAESVAYQPFQRNRNPLATHALSKRHFTPTMRGNYEW